MKQKLLLIVIALIGVFNSALAQNYRIASKDQHSIFKYDNPGNYEMPQPTIHVDSISISETENHL